MINNLKTGLMEERHEAVEIWLHSIHQQYASSLYRYALGLTCSVEDAQDVVQEVFTRISKQRRLFGEVRNVKSYLFIATRNASYSVLRTRKRCEALHETLCADLVNVCAPHIRQTSATILLIRESFGLLTIEQREVIVLKVLNQMTFKEIAEALQLPQSTVAGRYRHGIEKLRHVLEIGNIK